MVQQELAQAYKVILRAAQIAFKNDQRAIEMMRQRLDAHFAVPKNVADPQAIVPFAEQVANVLTSAVVQAEIQPKSTADNVEAEKKEVLLKLNIDPQRHALGDNNSRFASGKRSADGDAGASSSGCCGGSGSATIVNKTSTTKKTSIAE